MGSKHHIIIAQGNGRAPRPVCLSCHRPIVYGDRCPDCQRKLRQRLVQRRKLKR
jgi:hypothetical protein